MSETSQADQYLLDAIRRGDSRAWAQLIDRHQGRLLAFARQRTSGSADAEDLVQDTLISFLRSLDRFRGDASIETYLFAILRRRIIDRFRSGSRAADPLDDVTAAAATSTEPTASWYVRRDEEGERMKDALRAALRDIAEDFKRSLRFEELKAVEMIYTCGKRNKEVAAVLGITEQRVAMIKHRTLNRLKTDIRSSMDSMPDTSTWPPPFDDDVLREAWQTYRLSCPKRSTIGGYLLDTLDEPWRDFVDFHLNIADCSFCRANLTDLQAQAEAADHSAFHQRMVNSTIGFLHR